MVALSFTGCGKYLKFTAVYYITVDKKYTHVLMSSDYKSIHVKAQLK